MAATFKKADLHLHAPGTGQNFSVGARVDLNTAQGKKEFARRFVHQAREVAGLDIVAITNHNDVSWIEPIRDAAHELYGGALTVFPGVEVGADSGRSSIHVLALFDTDVSPEWVDRFLEDIGLPDEASRFTSQGHVRPSRRSFGDVLQAIDRRNGLAIAAHALSSEDSLLDSNSNRGLSRQAQFCEPLLLGVEVNKGRIEELEDWARFVVTNTHTDPGFHREHPIACLNSSDARSLDEIGTWYTYVKCERPDLDSLRQALLDHEARLRLRDDPPPIPPYVIESLSVVPTTTGFLRGLDMSFSPHLNCLIGGRGTGKSAIIELLRYLWEQEPMDRRRDEFNRFVPVFFPPTASARLDVCCLEHGTEVAYRLERRGENPTQVHRREPDGTYQHRPDLRPGAVFPLDIYGQKEILYTADDVRSQLNLLDRLAGAPLADAKEEEASILLKLEENRQAIVSRQRQIAQYVQRVGRLRQSAEKLERYRRAGLGEQATIKQRYEREQGMWASGENQVEDVAAGLTAASQQAQLDLTYLADEQLADLPNQADLRVLRRFLRDLSSDVRAGLQELEKRVADVKEQIDTARRQWGAKYTAFGDQYRELLSTLKAREGFDPDEILHLERDEAQLDQLQRDLAHHRQDVRRLVEERQGILRRLVENRHQQYQVRQHKAEDISARLRPRVRVSVTEGGDKQSLVETLRPLMTGAYLQEPDYQLVANGLGSHLLPFLAYLEDVEEEAPFRVHSPFRDLDLHPQPVPRLNLWTGEPGEVSPFSQLHPDKIRKFADYLGWERRLELDSCRIPDRVTIEVNIAKAGELPLWRPLGERIGEGVSVGQGGTAILSIILLESQRPLIIDQPEDDLDNRFVYDEVVHILRRERGYRQMLIATHNANIPVAGDAEQIFALDTVEENRPDGKRDLRCTVADEGFIDRPSMREQVSKILEGGQQAFELRKQKYGF